MCAAVVVGHLLCVSHSSWRAPRVFGRNYPIRIVDREGVWVPSPRVSGHRTLLVEDVSVFLEFLSVVCR